MSTGSYAYPNSYRLYAGTTKLPNSTVQASVGDVVGATAPGVTSFIPASTAFALSIPDNVTVYVSPTGSDTTGSGTFSAPFQSIQRCIDYIGFTGYNVSATIRVMGNLPFNLEASTDLRVNGLGEQEYPITITANTEFVTASAEVALCAADPVTGLWTVITAPDLFTTAAVGQEVVFTTGTYATYQPSSTMKPTQLRAMITSIIDPSTATLAFASATVPAPGDDISLLDYLDSMTTTLANPTADIMVDFGNLRFDNINWSITNALLSTTNITFRGDNLVASGLDIALSGGTYNLTLDCQLDTTYTSVNVGAIGTNNNYAGLSIGAATLTPVNISTSGDGLLTLRNSTIETPSVLTLEGNWSCYSSTFSGECTLTASGDTNTLKGIHFNADTKPGTVVSAGGLTTVSNMRVTDSTTSAFESYYSSLRVSNTALTNCSWGFRCSSNGYLILDGPTTTFTTTGPRLITADAGGQITLTGNLTATATGTPADKTQAAITLDGASSMTTNSDITLTTTGYALTIINRSSFSGVNLTFTTPQQRVMTVEGASNFLANNISYTATNASGILLDNSTGRCGNLTGTNANFDNVYCIYNAMLSITGTTLLTTTVAGTTLRVENGAQITTTAQLTANGVVRAVGLAGNGVLSSSANIIMGVTNNTGIACRVAATSRLYTTGAITLTTSAAGGTGFEVTYDGVLGSSTLTVTGFATGILANIGARVQTGTSNYTTSSYALDLTDAVYIATNTTTITATGPAIRLNRSTWHSTNVTIIGGTQSLDLTRSNMKTGTLICGQTTPTTNGILSSASTLETTTCTITAANGNAITLDYSSRMTTTNPTTVTHTSGGTCIVVNNDSIFQVNNLTATTVLANCISATNSIIRGAGNMSLTSSTGRALIIVATELAVTGTIALAGNITPTIQGGTLRSTNVALNPSGGGALTTEGTSIRAGANITVGAAGGDINLNGGEIYCANILSGITRLVAARCNLVVATATLTGTTGPSSYLSFCTGAIGTFTVSSTTDISLRVEGGNLQIISLTSSSGFTGAARVAVTAGAVLTINAINLTGGATSGTTGVSVVENSTLTILSGTITQPGSGQGVTAINSRLYLNQLAVSNCGTSAVGCSGVQGAMIAVTGTGNSQYGLNADLATYMTVSSTTTVTGTLGAVRNGSTLGVLTWANIGTAQAQFACDTTVARATNPTTVVRGNNIILQ